MTDAFNDDTISPEAARLKKLRFRAWRRGFREADFILGALRRCGAPDPVPGRSRRFRSSARAA